MVGTGPEPGLVVPGGAGGVPAEGVPAARADVVVGFPVPALPRTVEGAVVVVGVPEGRVLALVFLPPPTGPVDVAALWPKIRDAGVAEEGPVGYGVPTPEAAPPGAAGPGSGPGAVGPVELDALAGTTTVDSALSWLVPPFTSMPVAVAVSTTLPFVTSAAVTM